MKDNVIKARNKQNNCQHRIPFPAKISFNNEGEIKVFSYK